ncbi:MAG: 2-amino-4-hydroxy-6-hydroxymethyldihydropteridine diphosphokinase [Casimicrobiaceae bacterium]
MAALAYVGLGSNLNHPRRHVARALAELSRLPRSRLLIASPNYVSAPVGCTKPQPDYVNAVALLRTRLSPRALLARMHAIERRHRRDQAARATRNAPRTLDLDLLLYGRRRLRQRDLALPHPRMHQRAFVLRPLLDIAPVVRLPGHAAVGRLLRAVRDQRVTPTRRHAWR